MAMLFPQTPRVGYKKNPLEEVICQFRFPTILKITAQDPADFQEGIRKRYLQYEKADVGGPGLPEGVAAVLKAFKVPELSSQRHVFATEEGNRSVSLTKDFLAVSERAYQSWEQFSREVRTVVDHFERVYAPDTYTRIGLRYKDRIVRSSLGLADVPWSDLLNEELLGFLGQPARAQAIEFSMTDVRLQIAEVPHGRLRLRHGLDVVHGAEETSYLIDSDFFTEERSTADDAFKALDAFNTLAGNLFRWSIKDRLRDALEPSPVPR